MVTMFLKLFFHKLYLILIYKFYKFYKYYKSYRERYFMKTIQVSDEVHKILTNMGSKNQSYNDIIYSLIEKNRVMEEFNEEEVECYNKCIENLEKGDYSNTYKIKLEDLDETLEDLESKGILWALKWYVQKSLKNRNKYKKKDKIFFNLINYT